MTTIKLWFSPFTRSSRPRWLLEELGAPYELVAVDLKARAHKTPEYLEKVHPHGVVPAAEIDGRMMIESSAIVMTLADLFADRGLAPDVKSKDRSAYNQWFFYAQATLEQALVDVLGARKPDAGLPDEKKQEIEAKWHAALAFLERSLGKKTWLLGDAFSAADVVLGSILVWAHSSKALEGYPGVTSYAERCRSRPAFQRARG